MVRAVFCIQKIIHVTIATVMSERMPPSSSCASNVSVYAPKVRMAPMREREQHRQAHADPQPGQHVAPAEPGHVRHQDADDQRRLEAFAQADEEGREHGRSCREGGGSEVSLTSKSTQRSTDLSNPDPSALDIRLLQEDTDGQSGPRRCWPREKTSP